MTPEYFKIIEEHFIAKGHTKADANQAFAIFIENVRAEIEREKEAQKRDLDEEERTKICQTFTTENILDGYLQQHEYGKIIESSQKKSGEVLKNWVRPVGTGILSNVCFLALAAVLFAAGKDFWTSLVVFLGIID